MQTPKQQQTMRACVLRAVAQFEVCDIPVPQVAPAHVLVKVAAVGLCGTDHHIFAGDANYNMDENGVPIPLSRQPQILGHEICGTVMEVGHGVFALRPGDRVVIDQGLNCVSQAHAERCEYCRTDDTHQCEFYGEHGLTGLPGGLAEYITVPSVNAVRLETDLDAALAALAEPLGCVMHASDRVNNARKRYELKATDERRVRTVLICGAGPAGLLFVQYLRNVLGFTGKLLVSEPNADKRALATQFGASVIDPSERDVVAAVLEETSGRGVEYLIEASGCGQVFQTIPGLIRKQATVLLYGHGHAGVSLSVINNVIFREPMLVTSAGASGGFDDDGRPAIYRRALRLIESGSIDVTSIITHRYLSLESVQGAMTQDLHAPDYIKGIVTLD